MLSLKQGLFFSRSVYFFKFTTVRTLTLNVHTSKRVVTSFHPKSLIVRYFNDHEINEAVEHRYKLMDKIPQNNVIVYRAPLEKYIKATHYFSFGMALIVPAITIHSFFNIGAFDFPIYYYDIPLFRSLIDFIGFNVGFYLILSQLILLVYRFPTRIYHDKKGTYTAVFAGILPWSTVKEEIKSGEVKKSTSLMPWLSNILFQTKSRKILLFSDHFFRPVDFNNMLGENIKDVNN